MLIVLNRIGIELTYLKSAAFIPINKYVNIRVANKHFIFEYKVMFSMYMWLDIDINIDCQQKLKVSKHLIQIEFMDFNHNLYTFVIKIATDNN